MSRWMSVIITVCKSECRQRKGCMVEQMSVTSRDRGHRERRMMSERNRQSGIRTALQGEVALLEAWEEDGSKIAEGMSWSSK